MQRWEVTAVFTVEVFDELALREAAFRAMAEHMQDPNLVGIASSDGDPRDQAAIDPQMALTSLLGHWRPEFPGVRVLDGARGVKRAQDT